VIQRTKSSDERHEAGGLECWCLHGSVGRAGDWREISRRLGGRGIGTRALDLWRFLEGGGVSLAEFGQALNREAADEPRRGTGRALIGYSMGGRLALHALLEPGHPWQAAVIISAHPGLEEADARASRRAADAVWAGQAFAGDWGDFLARWHAQPVVAGSPPRRAGDDRQLALCRQEIARSFVQWSLGVQEPLWGRLAEITIPVLWIAGANDAKFLALATRATGILPNATLAIAPDAGHRVPSDAPDWLAETIAAFLATGPGAGII
jgi:2-succinyl-6-hydroxy-2,4-cyclohexadiene-1-carboxylate synthase